MPTNRTVTITGIFADNANTTIPENPVAGVSYRNTSMTASQIRDGWPFKTIVDSSNFNQSMFEIFSISKQFEQYGFLPWSSLTDYPQGGFALGSDGLLYQAVQATGPSTTALDPTNDTSMTYWKAVQFGNKTGMVSPFAGKVAPEGWLICDGSALSRTTYASLFAVIGTSYGEGDGSTTFNIPNLVDYVIRGTTENGSDIGTYTDGRLPNITGTAKWNLMGVSGDGSYTGALDKKGNLGSRHTYVAGTPVSGSDGFEIDASKSSTICTNGATDVRPKSISMCYIIKY